MTTAKTLDEEARRLIKSREEDEEKEFDLEDYRAKKEEVDFSKAVFMLNEVEILKLENLSLKQELVIREKRELELEMGRLSESIRDRLEIPDEFAMKIEPQTRTVRAVKKEDMPNGKSRQ